MTGICDAFKDAGVDIDKLSTANIDLSTTTDAVSKSQAVAILNQSELTAEEKKAITSTLGLEGATKKAAASTALLNAALNVGLVAAFTIGIKALSAAWDAFNVTAKEAEEKLDSINSKISELTSEIKELNSLEYKNEEQIKRLDQLEYELDLQEQLLEIEQRRYNQELTGSKFSDRFDADNLYTIYYKEAPYLKDANSQQSEYVMAKNKYEANERKISEYDAKIDSTEDQQKKNKLIEKRSKLLEKQIDLAATLSEKEVEYYNYYTQAKEAVESGTLVGSDLENAKQLADLWKTAYEDAHSYSIETQKATGIFDYSKKIENVLDKDKFKGVKDELLTLGREGKLSTSQLDAEFKTLVGDLDDVGIETHDLYTHIMNLVDAEKQAEKIEPPELWDYSEMLSQLDSAKESFDVLDSAFAKLYNDDEEIGFEDFIAIQEAFKDVDGIENYIKQLEVAGEDADAVGAIFSDLSNEYLKQTGILDNLTSENANLVVSMLEEMGIANAEEIVLARLNVNSEVLAAQKQFLAATTRDVSEATAEEINVLIDEQGYSEQTRQELVKLALAKQTCNGTTLDFSGDIANIMSYVEILGGATSALNTLNYLKNNNAYVPSDVRKKLEETAKQEVKNALEKANSYSSKQNQYQFDYQPKYVGGSSTRDEIEKAAESAKNEFKEVFDFFDRRVKVLDDSINLLSAHLENVVGSFAKNNLIDAQIGVNAEKINNYTDALAMYTQKANEALSKLPANIAEKIKNGAVSVNEITGEGGEELKEAIDDYSKWADKISSCKQELAELKEAIRDLELAKFENIMQDFQDMFDIREDSKDLIDKQIDLFKEAGQLIGSSFYSASIEQSQKQLALLEEEKAKLVEQMTSALNSGRVNLCPAI